MTNRVAASRERLVRVENGWFMLVGIIGLLLDDIALLAYAIMHGVQTTGQPHIPFLVAALALLPFCIVLTTGFFTLQPNEARVLLLFGAYKGTVRQSGFRWGNPFYSNGPHQPNGPERAGAGEGQPFGLRGRIARRAASGRNKISLRARTLNVEKLKVNDKRGSPIEIAAVVVWRVADTAQAMFDVDDYQAYVHTQSESALRHLASQYSYDQGDQDESTLLGNVEEVSQALCAELQERLNKAGVAVDEARLTNLSYAPEIAQVMLRRQQAEAVIAARQKIVHGAVSMVDMALRELAEKHVVQLDDERRAAMVSNLMVVLCGESEVHPVVNTGTLYT
jgi:regulator of protease activity HflC (stomatin/prohibitin superfamily)